MTKITDLRVFDLRFPTSQSLDGSDAMNPDPDYSAAYVILDTDEPELKGHGLTFTIGRGNEICCMAIKAMRHLVVGTDLATVTENPGKYWRHLTGDSQTALDRPGQGRDASRHRRCRQCCLGFAGQKGGQTRLAACCRYEPGRNRRYRRLPLSD